MTPQNDTDDPSTERGTLAVHYPEIYTQLEYAIAPDHLDERPHFIRLTLEMVREQLGHHPDYDNIVGGLERALDAVETGRDADADDDLRGVYGSLPYRREASAEAASSAEDARETYERAHGPDGLPGRLEHSVQADVDVPRDLWDRIARNAREKVARGKDPGGAFWGEVYEFVEVVPNIVVEGKVKGIDDALADDEADLATDGGVSETARQVARVLDIDAADLQAAADEVGEAPDEYARTGVEFRRTSANPKEIGRIVDDALESDG